MVKSIEDRVTEINGKLKLIFDRPKGNSVAAAMGLTREDIPSRRSSDKGFDGGQFAGGVFEDFEDVHDNPDHSEDHVCMDHDLPQKVASFIDRDTGEEEEFDLSFIDQLIPVAVPEEIEILDLARVVADGTVLAIAVSVGHSEDGIVFLDVPDMKNKFLKVEVVDSKPS